jgi:hypothetical protein
MAAEARGGDAERERVLQLVNDEAVKLRSARMVRVSESK